jgi:hypothetical protein
MVTTIETGNTSTPTSGSSTRPAPSPRDTLYVSVLTTNATANTMLKTIVTFQTGQVVDSSSQAVAPPALPAAPRSPSFTS